MKAFLAFVIVAGCFLPLFACNQQRTPESGPSIQAAPIGSPTSEAKEPRTSAFKDFDTESEALSKAAQCAKGKVTPAEEGLGAIFSWREGEAQTAKLFINGKPQSTRVPHQHHFTSVLLGSWHFSGATILRTPEITPAKPILS